MIKTCKICGKEFNARQRNYKYCSDECRNVVIQNQKKIYYKRWYDKGLEQRKQWNRKHAPAIYCKICGKEVPKLYESSERVVYRRYHDECIVDTAITAIKNGERLARSQTLRRAYNHGYTIHELKRIAREREKGA